MVTISYSEREENFFIWVKVEGHASFSQKGKDIICAGISSIVEGSFVFFKNFYFKFIELKKEKSSIKFKPKDKNYEIQICLKMMIHQLKNIEIFYPSYLKITKV